MSYNVNDIRTALQAKNKIIPVNFLSGSSCRLYKNFTKKQLNYMLKKAKKNDRNIHRY